MKFWKRALLINLAVILAIVAGLGIFFATPWGRPVFKTILLIPEIWPAAPIHPLRWITREPVVETVAIPSGSEEIVLNIYRPNDKKRHPAALFIMLGVDPRAELIVGYAKSFARIGMVIAVPNNKDYITLNVKTSHIKNSVDAFKFLESQDYVDSTHVGFIGPCAGGGYSLLAAADEEIADRVNFIVTIATYFDMLKGMSKVYPPVITQDDRSYNWNPNPLTIEAGKRVLINSLSSEEEKILLTEMINYKIQKEENFTRLSLDGQQIYNLLVNKDPTKTVGLLESLALKTRNVIVELSPRTKINKVKAKVFILGDLRDNFVPRTENQDLAKSLPENQVDIVELDLLEHSQLVRRLPRLRTVKQLFELFLFTYRVLDRIS